MGIVVFGMLPVQTTCYHRCRTEAGYGLVYIRLDWSDLILFILKLVLPVPRLSPPATRLGLNFHTALFARASVPNRETGSWTPVCHTDRILENSHSGQRADWAKRKPILLLRFERVFLLRLAGTQVPRSIVPGTAPNHALMASSRPAPLLKLTWLNITSRNPAVSA